MVLCGGFDGWHHRLMDLDTYRQLAVQARAFSHVPQEAEDLLQDTLVAGLQAGRDDHAWLVGTMRQLAAMTARTAVRRRRREQDAVITDVTAIDTTGAMKPAAVDELLRALPPAGRRLVTLALHGLDAEEIRWILAITPTAFRQRLTSIRKVLQRLPNVAVDVETAMGAPRTGDHSFGLMRRALKAALHGRDGLGSHDHDGHLLLLRRSPPHTAN